MLVRITDACAMGCTHCMIGDVDSTPMELQQAVLAMGEFDRCELERNLPNAHRQAIGLPVINKESYALDL
jgi:hypothetical protein